MFKYLLVATLIAFATAESEDHHADTKVYKIDIRHDGWESVIETTNHIRQAAHGDEHNNVEGDFSWVDPKGEHVAIKYVANEHGYQPEGDVIPPTPIAILKSLEYIKSHPAYEEKEQHHHQHH